MRRPAWAVLAAVVLLAGCSGGDDPAPRIAPSDSTSAASMTAPPPTPTGPVEPTLPPKAAGEDAAAAEAFVRFYWEMVNYAQATGDVDVLRSLATNSCAACKGGVDAILDTHSLGGSIEGGAVQVVRMDLERYGAGQVQGFLVTVGTEIAPQTVEVPGKKPKSFPGGSSNLRMIVERVDDQWQVARMDPS